MTDKNKQEAAKHAARAAQQMKHSANNVVQAAELGAEHMKAEMVEGVKGVLPASPRSSFMTGFALSALLIGGGLLFNGIRGVYRDHKAFSESTAKAVHNIQSN